MGRGLEQPATHWVQRGGEPPCAVQSRTYSNPTAATGPWPASEAAHDRESESCCAWYSRKSKAIMVLVNDILTRYRAPEKLFAELLTARSIVVSRLQTRPYTRKTKQLSTLVGWRLSRKISRTDRDRPLQMRLLYLRFPQNNLTWGRRYPGHK
jgi:hypothetical protein